MLLPPQLRWGIITVGCALGLCVSAFSAPPPVPKERLHSRILGGSGGDPVRTIVIAANDRELDPEGKLKKLRDVDCSASVAGALVGALRGVEAFPSDWVRATVEANKRVYGIDLEANARHFGAVVYGLSDP